MTLPFGFFQSQILSRAYLAHVKVGESFIFPIAYICYLV